MNDKSNREKLIDYLKNCIKDSYDRFEGIKMLQYESMKQGDLILYDDLNSRYKHLLSRVFVYEEVLAFVENEL